MVHEPARPSQKSASTRLLRLSHSFELGHLKCGELLESGAFPVPMGCTARSTEAVLRPAAAKAQAKPTFLSKLVA